MLGNLIVFDKNGSDLNTMMLTLVLIRTRGVNDSISRFNFKREMELFNDGTTVMPVTEPPGYVESSRNYYNKTKFLRMFGMLGLVKGTHSNPDIVITKRGQAILDCITSTISPKTPGPGNIFSYAVRPNKQKIFDGLFVDGFVFGSFGKNNCGLETSNTDVEFPKILLKTILTTGYVTSAESFYLADGLNEGVYTSYENAIANLSALRLTPTYQATMDTYISIAFVSPTTGKTRGARVNYANDNKIIGVLEQINIIQEVTSSLPKIHKHYELTTYARNNFLGKLQLLLPVYRPQQLILSGVPGTGKSYYADNTIMGGNSNPNNVIRTIIHPDYTYADFVGYQKPKKNPTTGKIEFIFKPGPLTKALEKCFSSEKENVYLVIEEMNRGDFAAVMGDTFQLLDRVDDFTRDDHGWSQYPIVNKLVYDYLVSKNPALSGVLDFNKIKFPSNLNIIGTMNTADQNVFVLDTAFRRRFRNIYLRIDYSESTDPGSYLSALDAAASTNVFGGAYTWTQFAKKVNEKIDEINADTFTIPEDKKLAPYFITMDDVLDAQSFCDKVMYYLKSDVFMYVEDYFNDSYQKMYQEMVLNTPPINPYSYL